MNRVVSGHSTGRIKDIKVSQNVYLEVHDKKVGLREYISNVLRIN